MNNENEDYIKTYKVIVIGDTNVGKTCLTMRVCEGKFPQRSEATIGVDFKEKIVKVNGEQIRLQFWDSAGQERFRNSLVPHYYRNVHAVVFVYDVTRRSSFENLFRWLEEFRMNIGSNYSAIPQLIIGNKCDLHADREVPTSEASALAKNFGVTLWETSAKSEFELENVNTIFQALAATLKTKTPQMKFPPHIASARRLEKHGIRLTQSSSSHSLEPKKKRSVVRSSSGEHKKCC